MGELKRALPEGYSVLGKEHINQIFIFEPRWHDRVALIARYRVFDENEIIIMHNDFSRSYYLTREQAERYPTKEMPTKRGGTVTVYQIPLDDLEKEILEL